MGRKAKIWLIAAAVLTLLGCMILGGAMAMLNWDFTKLSTVKYETNEYAVEDNYKNISIVTDTADIVFLPSENGQCSVLCHEQVNVKHSVSVDDGTLVVAVKDTRKWYEHISISFGTPKITIRLPQEEYGALSVKSSTGDVQIPKDLLFESITISESTGHVTSFASATGAVQIKTSTGKIFLENISAGSLDLSVSTGTVTVSNAVCQGDMKLKVSTGKAKLTHIQCQNMTTTGSTGSISFQNVISANAFSVERSTGDITLDRCDAAELFIRTDTGDVKLILCSDKVFLAQTDTGRVDVPKTISGGKCEIITSTGNIKASIVSAE